MITKKVFKDLAIFMIGFGIIMGIVFPFFVVWMTDVDYNVVLTFLFFSMCITAGFLVGVFNVFLARIVVGKKLRQLSYHMGHVEKMFIDKTKNNDSLCFDDDECYINMNLDDNFGECAQAFNTLVKSLAASMKTESAVRDFTELLSSRLELDKLAHEALSNLIENFNAAGGAILMEKAGELIILSSFGINSPESIVESDVVWGVLKNQKSKLIKLPKDIVLNGVLIDYRPSAILIEPLIHKDVVIGTIILATVEDFSEEMQCKLRQYGQGLTLALKNAITHDQLQKLAADDPLTGILNRRFGLLRLKDEYARAVRTDASMGLLMFDIDHFKKINDTYGHLVGDKVLVCVAEAVKTVLREGDIFMRYGGEEFLVVLPGASIVDSIEIAERIRHVVEDTVIQNNTQTIKVTVSVGGTSYPERGAENSFALINHADKKLYQAKDAGRNRTFVS